MFQCASRPGKRDRSNRFQTMQTPLEKLAVGNKLYGTTGAGGDNDGGTVFVLALK
mgnify:CR=1 FL=1